MKGLRKYLLLGCSLVLGKVAVAQDLPAEQVQISGSACHNRILVPDITNTTIHIPLSAMVEMRNDVKLTRGTCQFTMPIRLASNQRLVITGIESIERLDLFRASDVTAQIEVFYAGEKGVLIKDQISAKYYKRRQSRLLSAQQELRSACGEDLNLRGNSSLMLTGTPNSKVSLKNLRIHYRIENCR